MAVDPSEIKLKLSGGSGNTDPNSALGGAISTDPSGVITTNVLNNLFDDAGTEESYLGDVEFRGIYIVNTSASSTLADARAFISSLTSSTTDEVDIALADEAINTTIETIANENTPPVGPVFTRPTTYGSGIALNSATGLAAGDYQGIWIRRTVDANSPTFSNDSFSLTIGGNT